MNSGRKILGSLLATEAGLTEQELGTALEDQRRTGARIGETLVRSGVVTAEQVASALARQLGLAYAPPELSPEGDALGLLEASEAVRRRVVPLSATARSLRVAMEDPLDADAIDDVGFQTGRRVEPVVASHDSVQRALDRYFGGSLQDAVDALPEELRTGDGDGSADGIRIATRSVPVVQLVDSIIRRAIDARASDIHVEEAGDEVRVRYRIDGVLREALILPAAARHAVLSRLKVMADMDISVKRRAQDGGIALRYRGRSMTLRVSTLPANGGEKAVLRILDAESAPRGLESLGMSSDDLKAFRALLECGEGVILVAGPTGSGKSTTIFAALSELDRERQNLVTLEDPVEYRLRGANQIQVDPKAGLDFAAALRSVLRQDPDVVMVGEIRDRETAEIAMTAAVTGHLVLSTIHTTDAPGAVTRLLNMGVPPFLVAGGLSGVLAQRLVRKSCERCRGRGCDRCGDGHWERTGVFQLLSMSDPIRDAVSRGERSSRIRALAVEGGMGSMAADARRALASGLTTPHEIARLVRTAASGASPCPECQSAVPFGAVGCPRCGRTLHAVCACGTRLEGSWRFCPMCLRAASRGT